MSTRTKAAEATLTPYESEQVQQIAAWKSSPPSSISELFKAITMPVADRIEKAIPDAPVRVVIEKSYSVSEMLAGKEDIKRRAGVQDLGDLWQKPLEECDRLALQVGAAAQGWATVEGALTGAGGVITTLIDVPILFVLSLRTILRIGHCYGYALDQHKDQKFVLGVLIAATSGSLAVRRQRLDQLHEIEHWLLEETQEEIVTEEALSVLFQLEIFEQIPGIGAISGAVLNLLFIRRVENTARRVFQERWLRRSGKVHVVEPAAVHARHLAPGWSGTMGRAAHSGIYSLSFAAAFPVCFVSSAVQTLTGSIARGLRDTAADALDGAGRVLTTARGKTQSLRGSSGGSPVPAPV
jgi:hypothetical protein